MKTTTNYGFKQPEGTDIVNIDDISDNFGSVDTEIKKANDKVVAHEGKGGSVHADVTTTASGFMSAADKTKLNGIAAGAQTNQNAVQSIQVVTPTGTVVGTATAANTTDTIQLKEGNNIDIAVSGKVVTVNNTYSYTHPSGDGNLHVPATGTSNSGKVLKAGATAGSLVWGTLTPTDVGALPTSHEGQGGTVHADVTTTVSGFMSAADKTKLNGIATGANKVEIGTTNGNIKVNGTETNVYTHPTGTNPHGATKADIGLSNVTNDSQVKRSEMGVASGVATLDANGVNKQPPISHASTGTSYGVADTSNYGHVKIGDGIAVSSGTISVDVGDGVVLSGTSPNQKLVTDVGTGLTLEGTSPNKKIALANSGVTAGTYEKVTVDAKGRITSGGDLTASDVPNIPWSKITSGKPTTLSGYGITDGQQYPLTNSNGTAKTYYGTTNFDTMTDSGQYSIDGTCDNNPRGGASASGVLEVKVSAGAIMQEFTYSQQFIGSYGGCKYIRSYESGAWSSWVEYFDRNSNSQQYRLTASNGLCLSTIGDGADFNNYGGTGNYLVSSQTTLTNSPFTGGIFGILQVQQRTSATSFQTFLNANTGEVYNRGQNSSGNWTSWRRTVSSYDFAVNKGDIGYQVLPSGVILQWGYVYLTPSAINTIVSTTVTFPVAFPSNLAALSVNANTSAPQAVVASYDIPTKTTVRLNLRRSNDTTQTTVSWIAVGY